MSNMGLKVILQTLLEDFPCKEEKVEDFVVKLEEVVETKVAYFYTPSPKNSKVSAHDSNPSQTMTPTACRVGHVCLTPNLT